VLDGGLVIHVDLAIVAARVAVEIDHSFWHGSTLAVHRDKERDRLLSRRGWRPVRVTEMDIQDRLATVVDDIVAIAQLRPPMD
jgi:very-short-patch-repair endonuclease